MRVVSIATAEREGCWESEDERLRYVSRIHGKNAFEITGDLQTCEVQVVFW